MAGKVKPKHREAEHMVSTRLTAEEVEAVDQYAKMFGIGRGPALVIFFQKFREMNRCYHCANEQLHELSMAQAHGKKVEKEAYSVILWQLLKDVERCCTFTPEDKGGK